MPRPSATLSRLVAEEPSLLSRVDLVRLDASRKLNPSRRSELGQFMTPAPVASFMASLPVATGDTLRVLDAGAGVGSLSAALVESLLTRARLPSLITIEAWEIDPTLAAHLRATLDACGALCRARGVRFTGVVHTEDFIEASVATLDGGLFRKSRRGFDLAILNPPYHKIRTDSPARAAMRRVGLETTNLYAAFLALAVDLLSPGGELVAITPRSFCNGPYFRPFRERLLAATRLRRLHVFDRRDKAFNDDEVLQETLILHALKDPSASGPVVVSSSESPDDPCPSQRAVPYEQVVHPSDPQRVLHIVSDGVGRAVGERVESLRGSLDAMGAQVSTGRVVDFRAKEHLRDVPGRDTAPLIYPSHFERGAIRWPKPEGRKPNAIVACAETAALLLPAGTYVLTRRFSAKEEPRRIVAVVYEGPRVGFENHLNVFHAGGRGLDPMLARGLAAWLNSTLADAHFRAWSGHTQVNATDLRRMPYPTQEQLVALAAAVGDRALEQRALDGVIEEVLFPMSDRDDEPIDPVAAKARIDDAIGILKDLGLPPEQQNERSALTLLALLDLPPTRPWSEASAPLRGITPMMQFFERHYGKTYAPNTRETVRRFTVHQFVDAGIAVENPDAPKRPTNSPKAVYQVEAGVLDALRAYGTSAWAPTLAAWLSSRQTLQAQYAQAREMDRVPVDVGGRAVKLSPGAHNDLVKRVIDEFCPRFTPGASVLYLGDTASKFAHFDEAGLTALGVTVDEHGRMPDVVIHHRAMGWLVLVEAVTSHGPVNPKRRAELAALFGASTAGLVYVTAFADRRAMTRYLADLSWETEVWVADAPSHMIHFNGERFLGPY
ncbi:MAG: BsuBI/PstI family type II restriction endonuclease [Polyangiales bacterium]